MAVCVDHQCNITAADLNASGCIHLKQSFICKRTSSHRLGVSFSLNEWSSFLLGACLVPVQMPAFNTANVIEQALSEPTNKSSEPKKLHKIIRCCWQLASLIMRASCSQTGGKKEEDDLWTCLYCIQTKWKMKDEYRVPFFIQDCWKKHTIQQCLPR